MDSLAQASVYLSQKWKKPLEVNYLEIVDAEYRGAKQVGRIHTQHQVSVPKQDENIGTAYLPPYCDQFIENVDTYFNFSPCKNDPYSFTCMSGIKNDVDDPIFSQQNETLPVGTKKGKRRPASADMYHKKLNAKVGEENNYLSSIASHAKGNLIENMLYRSPRFKDKTLQELEMQTYNLLDNTLFTKRNKAKSKEKNYSCGTAITAIRTKFREKQSEKNVGYSEYCD